MCTYLGASEKISDADISEEIIKQSKILFLTAYSWDAENSKNAALKAIDMAHKHGNKVAFTLSDPKCVARHRADLLALISEHVDILFANEQEIQALFETDSHEEAVKQVTERYKDSEKIAALTCGKEGAMVVNKDGTITVASEKIENIEDTTGAGALFVSGFLYGQTHNMDLQKSAELANKCAAEIIKTFGARPTTELKSLL